MATNLATTFPIPVGFNAPKGLYANICMPADPSLVTGAAAEFDLADIRAPLLPPAGVVPAPALTFPAGTIVRQVYLNEKVDGATATPLGMQLNGVPFEYKVTETPKHGLEGGLAVREPHRRRPPHAPAPRAPPRRGPPVVQRGPLQGHALRQHDLPAGPAPGNEMQVVPT